MTNSLKEPLSSMSSPKSLQRPSLKRCICAVWILATSIVVLFIGVSALSQSIREELRKEMEMESSRSTEQEDSTKLVGRGDWGGDLPGYCNEIIANPKPNEMDCTWDSKWSSERTNCKGSGGETLMYSQFHQDYYLYTRHFSKLKRPGVYLDIATNNPVYISNTYFMDRCLGWKGICVEANPFYYEKIHRFRSCDLVPTCVGRTDGERVEFAMKAGSGAILGSTNKNMDSWEKDNVTIPTMMERCTTVKNILDRWNVREIDYLSLDVEGHEIEVLKGIDWKTTKIMVMTVEVSGGILKELEELMEEVGYKRHWPDLSTETFERGLLTEDAVYLHPDVTFGAPV